MNSNIKELNRKRKEILLNMNPEEIVTLFKEINRKVINAIGTSKNGFKWNVEEMTKANNELIELEKILSEKYSNIHGLTASTRLELLVNKYAESNEEIKSLIFNVHFERLLSYVKSLENNICYLEGVLKKYYFRYSFRTWNLEKLLLEELKVPEDIVLDTLEPYIYYNSNFFSKSLEKDFNSFVKAIVEYIELDIANIKTYLDVELEPSKFIEEDVIIIVEGIIQLKILATSLIKRYGNLIANPFEEAINIEAEVKNKIFNDLLKEHDSASEEKSIEEEKEIILAKAPSYNFETFELIVPEEVDPTEKGS